MKSRGGTSSGFTLFELIVVLAIIALTIALAAPTLAGFARSRALSDTATEFVALASFARNRAITDGQVYRITLDLNANTFTVTHDDGSGNFVAVDSANGGALVLSSDIHFETDAPEVDQGRVIEFQPQGRTDPATVRFLDVYGNAVNVVCDSPFDHFRIVSGPDAEVRR